MMNYIYALKTFVIAFCGSGLAIGLALFIAKRYLEKSIQHRFDLSLENFKDRLKSASDSRLEDAKNQFVIGATSHMANTLFDKHVEFCEAYVFEMQLALSVLMYQGPTEKLKDNAERLKDIRLKARVWLPASTFDRLLNYEMALHRIAIHDRHQKAYGPLPGYRERPEYQEEVDRVIGLYSEIIDEGPPPEGVMRPSVGTSVVIEELRKVLGIEELSRLRGELIRRASLD
jgi:hypothetical protein